MSDIAKSITAVGLGTVADVVVPDAGLYYVNGSISLPKIPEGSTANSAVVALIKKNGSTQYTGLAGAQGFFAKISCSASDELTVVLSSAAAVDQDLQAVKTTTTIGLSV